MSEAKIANLRIFTEQSTIQFSKVEGKKISIGTGAKYIIDIIDQPMQIRIDTDENGVLVRFSHRSTLGTMEDSYDHKVLFSLDGKDVLCDEDGDYNMFRFQIQNDDPDDNEGVFAKIGRSYIYFIETLLKYLEEQGELDSYSDFDNENEGILMARDDNGNIGMCRVKGKQRPSLLGSGLFGTETCRPYIDEMMDSFLYDAMDVDDLTEEAEDGDTDAMTRLANAYYNGDDDNDIEQDMEKAFYWYGKLAEEDDPTGQYNLAIMYVKGEGTERDFEKALYWMEKADENGDSDAEGHIVKYKKIVELQKKTDEGDMKACAELAEELMGVGMLLGNDESSEGVYKESIEYAEKAAKENIPHAFWVLALAYSKGRGVDTDLDKAVNYYEKGAKLGDAACQHGLGCYYLKGDFLRKNNKKAFELIKKAAEQGYALGMKDLGRCYQFGLGCMGNMKTALEWYTKASELLDDQELIMRVMAFQSLADIQPNWGEDYEGEPDEEEEEEESIFKEIAEYDYELAEQGIMPDLPRLKDIMAKKRSYSIIVDRLKYMAEQGDEKAIKLLSDLEEFNASLQEKIKGDGADEYEKILKEPEYYTDDEEEEDDDDDDSDEPLIVHGVSAGGQKVKLLDDLAIFLKDGMIYKRYHNPQKGDDAFLIGVPSEKFENYKTEEFEAPSDKDNYDPLLKFSLATEDELSTKEDSDELDVDFEEMIKGLMDKIPNITISMLLGLDTDSEPYDGKYVIVKDDALLKAGFFTSGYLGTPAYNYLIATQKGVYFSTVCKFKSENEEENEKFITDLLDSLEIIPVEEQDTTE